VIRNPGSAFTIASSTPTTTPNFSYALFALWALEFLITIQLQKQNITFLFYPPRLSISILSLLFHISFIHLISPPSSFSISFRSFLSLSLISPHQLHMCSIVSLSSRHILHLFSSSVQYLPVLSLSLPLSLFPHLNLAIIFLSFALSLARYTGTSSVTHFSYSLLYLDSLACPYLCPSCSAPHTSIILPLSIFPLPHWHTRSFCSTSVSPSHPRSFSFLYSTQSVSCTLPFRLFCPRTLPLSFPLSLSACSSCTLRLFPHYVPKCFSVHSQHPSQIFLLHSLHHHLFLPSPDLCSVHQHVLYYALKHDIIIIIYTMK
jgi:hypothetical protein